MACDIVSSVQMLHIISESSPALLAQNTITNTAQKALSPFSQHEGISISTYLGTKSFHLPFPNTLVPVAIGVSYHGA